MHLFLVGLPANIARSNREATDYTLAAREYTIAEGVDVTTGSSGAYWIVGVARQTP